MNGHLVATAAATDYDGEWLRSKRLLGLPMLRRSPAIFGSLFLLLPRKFSRLRREGERPLLALKSRLSALSSARRHPKAKIGIFLTLLDLCLDLTLNHILTFKIDFYTQNFWFLPFLVINYIILIQFNTNLILFRLFWTPSLSSNTAYYFYFFRKFENDCIFLVAFNFFKCLKI